jgi:hypothetical protein
MKLSDESGSQSDQQETARNDPVVSEKTKALSLQESDEQRDSKYGNDKGDDITQ